MLSSITQVEVVLLGAAVVGVVGLPKIVGVVDTVRGQPRNGGQYDELRENKVKRAYFYIGMATLLLAILYVWTSV